METLDVAIIAITILLLVIAFREKWYPPVDLQYKDHPMFYLITIVLLGIFGVTIFATRFTIEDEVLYLLGLPLLGLGIPVLAYALVQAINEYYAQKLAQTQTPTIQSAPTQTDFTPPVIEEPEIVPVEVVEPEIEKNPLDKMKEEIERKIKELHKQINNG